MTNIKLTRAQTKLIRRFAKEGTVRFPSENATKCAPFSALDDHGFIVFDKPRKCWVLSVEGYCYCKNKWDDIEPLDLGNPFHGEELGTDLKAHAALLAKAKAQEAFEATGTEELKRDRSIREDQIVLLLQKLLPELPSRSIFVERRIVVSPDYKHTRAGFFVQVCVELKEKTLLPSKDRCYVDRSACIASQGELEHFAYILQKGLKILSELVYVGGGIPGWPTKTVYEEASSSFPPRTKKEVIDYDE